MSEGRCDAEISQVRESVGDEAGWLDKFASTCGLDAGHEGEHIFDSSEDDEHIRYDEATKRLGSYRDTPAEGASTLMRFDTASTE